MRATGTRIKRLLWVSGVSSLALFLSACAEDAPQDYLEPAGEIARRADKLWDLTFGIAAAVFFIVEGLLIYAIIKFRARPGREAAQFHGNTKLEVILTAIPALILAGIAIPTVRTVFQNAEAADEGELQITVVGKQFWWEYRYEDLNIVTANELHIPTGQKVFLEIEGTDVNHSFWVPKLGGKQDIIPGRRNSLIIAADEPGEYLGQCTEYCGDSHANMRLKVFAHDPADFNEWVSEQQAEAAQPEDELARAGQEEFENGACIGCHSTDPTQGGLPGPNLAHFGSRTTFAAGIFEVQGDQGRADLAAWLADPPGVKPGALMPDYDLSQEQIDALVAYLQSLE